MLKNKKRKIKRFSQREFTVFKTRKAGFHEDKRRKEKHKKKIFEEE